MMEYLTDTVVLSRYQPPTMRKLSKSAKVRAKKRERNAKKAEGAVEEKGEGNREGQAMNST